MSRPLAAAARRLADQTSGRIEAASGGGDVVATVVDFSAGLVTVLWRGQNLVARGYLASYTPAAGDRVLCAVVDHQLIVRDRIV